MRPHPTNRATTRGRWRLVATSLRRRRPHGSRLSANCSALCEFDCKAGQWPARVHQGRQRRWSVSAKLHAAQQRAAYFACLQSIGGALPPAGSAAAEGTPSVDFVDRLVRATCPLATSEPGCVELSPSSPPRRALSSTVMCGCPTLSACTWVTARLHVRARALSPEVRGTAVQRARAEEARREGC